MSEQQKSAYAELGAEAGRAFAEFFNAFADAFGQGIREIEEKAKAAVISTSGIYSLADQVVVKAFEIVYQATMDGVDEYGCFTGSTAAEAQPEETAEDDPPMYTEDCKRCWCDGCASLEDCTEFGRVGDGVEPSPCVRCNERNKGRLMPYEDGEPDCHRVKNK